VDAPDRVGARQVRDRARDAQHCRLCYKPNNAFDRSQVS
jgi:hypothetical protein